MWPSKERFKNNIEIKVHFTTVEFPSCEVHRSENCIRDTKTKQNKKRIKKKYKLQLCENIHHANKVGDTKLKKKTIINI